MALTVQPLIASSSNNFTADYYLQVFGHASWSSASNQRHNVYPTADTLKNAYAGVRSAPGAGKSVTFTLYVNGSATDVVVTISDSATSGSDITHTASITAGQSVVWKCTTSGSPTASEVYLCIESVCTTAGYTVILGRTAYLTHAVSTYYTCISGVDLVAEASSTSTKNCMLPTIVTLKDFYWELSEAPGSGNNYTATLLYSGSASAITSTISDTATAGSDTAHTHDVANQTHYLVMQFVPNSSPTTGYASWGFVADMDTDGYSPIMANTGIAMTRDTTEYQRLSIADNQGRDAAGADESEMCPAMTIAAMYVQQSGNSYSNSTTQDKYTYTLIDDGSDTAINVAVVGSTSAGSITGQSVSIAAGSLLTMRKVPNSNPTARQVRIVLIANKTQAEGWTNIAKVNGIASSSIAKVNGIAVASIAKINGVAV